MALEREASWQAVSLEWGEIPATRLPGSVSNLRDAASTPRRGPERDRSRYLASSAVSHLSSRASGGAPVKIFPQWNGQWEEGGFVGYFRPRK